MASFATLKATLAEDNYDKVWDALEAEAAWKGDSVESFEARELCASGDHGNSLRALEEHSAAAALKAAHPDVPDLTLADCRRFSRARQGNAAKAAAFLEADVAWRRDVKPREIAQGDLPIALPTGAWRVLGRTDAGSPVLLVSTALWQPHLYDVDEYARYVTYFCEGLVRMGPRFVVLFDMAGWQFSHVTHLKKVLKLVDTVQNHYPERLERALLLRAPFLFSASWKVIKPWIDPNTAKKVAFTSGAAGEKKAFADAGIVDGILPAAYGGTRKTPVPVPNIDGEKPVAVRAP